MAIVADKSVIQVSNHNHEKLK
ncbi:hypothetical protein CRE_21677 [Caenorhabditis remanei]|uniref:Uncharacterized protein n=1 Tax=Caenorhabditis remanei TaxID=31234 RepID=E3NSS7_CAERE|nr:hypothetical protein CRE_21677 [Caenorhabditis remanei]